MKGFMRFSNAGTVLQIVAVTLYIAFWLIIVHLLSSLEKESLYDCSNITEYGASDGALRRYATCRGDQYSP